MSIDPLQIQAIVDAINSGATIIAGSVLALIFAVTWRG